MSREFNPDPWNRSDKYVDRTYASGVASERPKLTTRIHCLPEEENVMREAALSGPAHERGEARAHELAEMREADAPAIESAADRFHRQLRAGHGFRNEGE